jgi:hypothetical protein
MMLAAVFLTSCMLGLPTAVASHSGAAAPWLPAPGGQDLTPAPVSLAGFNCSQLGVCCDDQGYCFIVDGGGPSCTPDTTCTDKTYTAVRFVKQKASGKCIYDCDWTTTCTVTGCGSDRSFPETGTDRFNAGIYAVGACPAANLGICGPPSEALLAGSQ